MGLFDRSSSRTSTSNTYNTETNTQQTDQSGNQGLNFSNLGGGVSLTEQTTVNTLDGGALRAAGDIAEGAYGLGKRALDVGESSIGAVAKVNADSIEMLSGLVTGALDNSKTVTRDVLDASRTSVKEAISGFSTLAQQNSASSDDRLQKVVTYAIAGIAAIIILPKLFGGGGRTVIA